MTGYYAQALLQIIPGKTDAELAGIIERLISLLNARGELALLPAIRRELLRQSKARQDGPEVTVASQKDAERFAGEIREALRALGAPEAHVTLAVDETLVDGFVVRAECRYIDRSAKRTLLAMHHTLLTPA